jgi:2-polyprenyl-6-methoxyphenol hydroxylase-like FAD-dependent oxidoreductase
MNIDVAIVGGGPGGCAAALSLRSFAPSLSVVLIEASHYDTPRIGETLPPPARALLEHLGVWDAFLAAGHRPVYGTTSVWGGAAPSDNDFIYTPAANGWHLDRTAFDAMLAKQAATQGTAVIRGRVMDVTGGSLTLHDGTVITARFLVDATGGAATIARRRGAFFITSDTLTAFARFFPDPGGDPRTIVEAFAEGWWYTAALPGGARIAACMTDADTGRRLRLHDASAWGAHLSALPHLGTLLGAHLPPGLVTVRPAESRRLDPPAGKDWIAVGDAASRFDPLSSQGIIKALRSGIFASYAVADFLLRGDDTGLTRYRRFIRDEFDSYTEVRTKVYAEEQRWPQSEFWRRRQGAA